MTTIRDIENLLSGGSLSRGNALFILQQMRKGGTPASPGLRHLCEEVASRPKDSKPPIPLHPEQQATRAGYLRAKDAELTPSELMWLQRLPQDPKAVSFEDAARLASLAGSISATKAPDGARLVHSIWQPVKDFHDRRVAEAKLEQARQPLPAIPHSAQSAIEDLLVGEHPDVDRGELDLRAQRLLAEFNASRQGDHERHVSDVESTIATIDQRVTERQSIDGQVAS